jgi:hypothetical protein
MPQEYVMAGRVCVLLRGLGYALKYKISAADAWAPLARKLLREYGEEEEGWEEEEEEEEQII